MGARQKKGFFRTHCTSAPEVVVGGYSLHGGRAGGGPPASVRRRGAHAKLKLEACRSAETTPMPTLKKALPPAPQADATPGGATGPAAEQQSSAAPQPQGLGPNAASMPSTSLGSGTPTDGPTPDVSRLPAAAH